MPNIGFIGHMPNIGFIGHMHEKVAGYEDLLHTERGRYCILLSYYVTKKELKHYIRTYMKKL